MNYDEFIEKIKESGIDLTFHTLNGKFSEKQWYIYCSTHVGGFSGASCWDNAPATYQPSNATEEQLTKLDEILAIFRPQMTFLEYRVLSNSVVEETEEKNSDYYGNSDEYKIKYCRMEKLYEYLSKKDWL